MGADQLGRQQHHGGAVDVRTVVGVVAVRGPHALDPFHDPQVDAPAAAAARLDLQIRESLVQGVQEPVEGEGLIVDGRRPVARARLGADRHMPGGQDRGVVVPLDVGDVQSLDEGGDGAVQVVPRSRRREVEDPLTPVLDRPTGAVGQDPVGMGAGELGVAVDHLRLEPQAQLHAQAAHVLGQRFQAGGPGLGRDPPVAQTRGVVAPGAEPAVVDDEALDADPGGLVGQRREGARVVVEVDGLPHVEQHRPWPRGVGGQGAQMRVGAGGQSVQALPPGADEPRRGVGPAGRQDHLAGVESLARAQEPIALGRVSGQGTGVAGPCRVHAVDTTAAPAETGGSRDEPGGGVVPRTPLPGLAHPGARGEGSAHETALEAVVAGHVKQFGGLGGHRQQRSDLVHLQRRRTGPGDVGHSCAQPHQPAGLQADLGENLDAVDGVGAARDDDIGLTARARLRGHLMEDLADVGGEG